MGNERGFRRYLGADGGGKPSILGVGRGEWRTLRPTSGVSGPHDSGEPSDRNSRQELSFSLSLSPLAGTLLVRPFVARGSAPSLCPVLCSTSLRGVSRKLSKGGVPPPATASHHTSTNRERAAPPLPFSPSASGFRREIQAGDSGGRNSGRRFRREKFRQEMSGGRNLGGRCPAGDLPPAPARTFSAQSCVPHPSGGDRGRAVRVGWCS